MRHIHEIRELLHAYRDLSECVLESVEWSDHGTTLTVRFDYAWMPDGSVRQDEAPRLLVDLRFNLVQELEVHNQLPPAVIADPSLASWGLAEVSRIEVRDDARSAAFQHSARPFHHLTIRRESGPWIDLVFSELTVEESRATPRAGGP